MDDLSASQTRLLDALPHPDAGPATPADLATASGLGYSTVTRLLRDLAAAGLATRDDQGWRAAGPASEQTSPPATADNEEPADDEPADTVTTDEAAGAEPAPDEADAPAGKPAGADDASESLAAQAPEPDADPEHRADVATAQPAARSDADTTPAGEAAKVRMGKGQLRELVLIVLREDSGEMGPTQIAKRLPGRSQGAIANACDRLVEHGDAVLTSEKPRRYTATTAG